ncbi:OpgC domain-containing protein [Elioraea rosea]|uniref:OpgC domain-containing protein n=1 Tax=Elioraea rosea TaxID=2492390 RepID=UPI0013150F0D|nr:OpgC domain-containing protein [Elioraea rosea]
MAAGAALGGLPIAFRQHDFLARSAARPSRRDHAIDIARGIALIFILYPHFTQIAAALGSIGRARVPYLSDLQFCDPADFFVFLSGYVYGLVYGQRAVRDGYRTVVRQTVRRMAQIFRAMVFTVALCVGLSWLLIDDPAVLRALDLLSFERSGREAIAGIALLLDSTLFINILALYLLLLATAPLFLWGFRRSVAATAAVSLGIWLLVQIGPLHVTSTWAGMHSFNPFAWQLLFAMGILLGMQRGFDAILASMTRAQAITLALACLGFFALRTGIRVSPALAELVLPIAHKPAFGPLRLANFVCLVPVFVLAVGWLERQVPVLANLLARSGALSLEMFCVGVVLTLLMGVAFLALGGTLLAYGIVLTAGIALYLVAIIPLEAVS